MKPICYDLFCGLFGWSEAFAAEGYHCVGYDIVDMSAEVGRVPPQGCELVLRDVRSIHGSELKDAACIVGSSPCQEFSYRAMPWKRAKALPPPYLGIELFNHQFRIQREASEAAGKHIPLIVENVRGAQKWVGRAAWHYGSYYLWGDVPALMPVTASIKNYGGSWFNIGSPGQKVVNQNPVHALMGTKQSGISGPRDNGDGVKRGITIGGTYAERKARGDTTITTGSRSRSRKAASAMIAKIPYPLAQHIARTYYPAP